MVDVKSLKVLITDPDKNDAAALKQELETDTKLVFSISIAGSLSEAKNFLHTDMYDIIISCLDLPDIKGFKTLIAFQKAASGVPFIALLKPDEHDLGAELLDMGAQDFIIKGTSELTLQQRSLFHAIERRASFQKLRALDDIKTKFTSMMTHELRTPLVSIKGFVSLLLHEAPGKINSEQREYLEIILKNTERQLRMITEMLDSARMEAGVFSIEKKQGGLVKLINRTVNEIRSMATEKHITLSIQTDEPEISVNMDDFRISQVILNLVNNSIKFAPENTKITLRARVLAFEEIKIPHAAEVQGLARGKYAVIPIIDEGEGIENDDLSNVFARFAQVSKSKENREKGTGLGLSISKSIVEAHGGIIWAESGGKDKGTTFTFILPV